MVHRSSPAPFLLKTYELVDDPATTDVISWNDLGTGFVVWKTADFAKDLLPNSFKHSNFSSFVRQLNTYGFHKIVPDKWEFVNQYFMRGRKELLVEIHRRKAVTTLKGDGDHGSSSTSSHDGSKSHGLVDAHKLENLFEENEKLKKEKESLKLEIAQAKKQCDDLMAFVSQCVKPVSGQVNRVTDGDKDVTGKESDVKNDGDDIDGECVRLFGVLLKDERKKRGCYGNNIETSGTRMKNMKLQGEFNNEIPWMNRACSVTKYKY